MLKIDKSKATNYLLIKKKMFTELQQNTLDRFADLSDELFEKGVITTDSFTGEIGEYVACQYFQLNKTARVTEGIDGICNSGNKYQVKSKIISEKLENFSFSTTNLKPHLFDYLVLVYFDSLYNPLMLIRISSTHINSDKFILRNSEIHQYECINKEDITIHKNIQDLLNSFANTIEELQLLSVIRSKRVVGDIGEFYACKRLNLKQSINKNEKGIDAINKEGATFEIKTRRVYESGRRKGETRRLNNLVGKTADYLIVVTLDRTFQCSGMWLIPMNNVANPKSANLRIVNNTPGTLNLIPSTISWLQTGNLFNRNELHKSFTKEIDNRDTLNVPLKKRKITSRVIRKRNTDNKPSDVEYINPKGGGFCGCLIWAVVAILLLELFYYSNHR